LGIQLIGTVSQVVTLTNIGVAIFFTESPSHIIRLTAFEVVIIRSDGTSATLKASREFARQLSAPGGEVIALLVRDASVSEIQLVRVSLLPNFNVFLLGIEDHFPLRFLVF